MNVKKNIPNIRFRGFSDDWKQRKLGDYASYRRGSFPQPYGRPEWYDGEDAMPFVQVIDVKDDMRLADETKQKISKLAQPMSVYAEKGQVLVTLQGSIGRVAVAQYGTFVDRTVLIFEKYKEPTDTYFWANVVKRKFSEEAKKAPGGTIKTITKEALSDFNVMLPTYAEQQKIGTFFNALDKAIALHQREYEKLQLIKKSMLENCFPKNGERVPRIRFSGFTGDWEQRKLSSLFDRFDDGDWIEAKDQSPSGIRLVQTGNVGVTEFIDKPDNKKWISEDTFDKLHCEEIFPGDILISRLPEPAGRACIVPETGTRMITAVDCTIARTSAKNSADFIVQCLSAPDYFKWVNTCLAGGTRQRISRSMLADYDVMVPPTVEEQQQIGQYFAQLDNLITLHQRKLKKLQLIKKSMLAQMFV